MLTQAQIKHLQNLKLKKYRQNYAEFIIEGDKLITEALLENAELKLICANKHWIDLHEHALPSGVPVVEVTDRQIEKISSLTTPQDVIAVIPFFKSRQHRPVLKGRWTLALDGINDPGNFGTIIRSADWFGIETIYCSEHCVELYNPKVIQASMGSVFRVEMIYGDIEAFLQQAQVKKYAATLNGISLKETVLGDEGICVIGSESHGISPAILKLCDVEITIPKKGRAESLNAAIATSILLSYLN